MAEQQQQRIRVRPRVRRSVQPAQDQDLRTPSGKPMKI